MEAGELFFLTFSILGGLALFIFGMNIMTDGLREAAGSRLRSILTDTTTNRYAGIGLGTVLGLLVHSSAATVMIVGFVNAGLMSLTQAIPPVLGANIGTTISMQAISFNLADYSLFAIAFGFILRMAIPIPKVKLFGLAIMGFGLLFLGMDIMSDAIKPHRETLQPLLGTITADSLGGLLLGVLVATLITAVIQSSGATIGMCFALIQAGVFTSLEQVFPIILGAHIGTCATALLGSIGTHIEARRAAFAHLFFNLFNVFAAILAKGFFLWLIPMTSTNLVRQAANLHTAVMLIAAAIVLPFTPWFGRLVTRVVRSRKPMPQASYLDDKLLEYPERALAACIRELQRVAKICARSLRLTADVILFVVDRKKVQEIKMNEKIVDEIKVAMREYLAAMTTSYLSRRQAILIQHIDRCIIDMERIGDHIDAICDLSLRRKTIPEAWVDRQSLDMLFALYEKALTVFKLVIESLDPDREDFQEIAARILQARDDYVQCSIETKSIFTDKVAKRIITPLAGMYFSEYVAALDRIVKHSKTIALAEKQPQFWIKRKKLDRHATEAPAIEPPTLVDPHDYLDRLQKEDYL